MVARARYKLTLQSSLPESETKKTREQLELEQDKEYGKENPLVVTARAFDFAARVCWRTTFAELEYMTGQTLADWLHCTVLRLYCSRCLD